jgi:hypothetical protein
MKIEIELPDEYQSMIDVIVADTEKQNPDRDDVNIGTVLTQMCRKFVVDSYAQIMINVPNSETG